MRFPRIALPVLCVALFTCTVAHADDYVIMEVGDRKIKKTEVIEIWGNLFPGGKAPDFDSVDESIRQNVLRGVLSEHLIYDEAKREGLADTEEVKKKIEEAGRKIVVRQYLEQKTKALVSEADLKAEYDAVVKQNQGKEEVRARHILVASEDKAKELKKKLDDGGSFEDLAKENSSDPGSKTQGGDLGYFTEEKMVPEFSKAAFAMKKGETSAPVKSGFGWHIIKVEDRRALKMPTYTELLPQIRGGVEQDKLSEFVNKLVDKTSVKYFGPDGKEKEFTKMPEKTK